MLRSNFLEAHVAGQWFAIAANGQPSVFFWASFRTDVIILTLPRFKIGGFLEQLRPLKLSPQAVLSPEVVFFLSVTSSAPQSS